MSEAPEEFRCTKCGAEVTTGMMAAFCPHKEACEFCPDDEESRAFLRAFCDGTLFETGAQHSQAGEG